MGGSQKRIGVCVALIFSVAMYLLLAYVVAGARKTESTGYMTLQLPLTILAGLAILGCAGRALTGLSPAIPEKTFTVNMIVALALAEAAAILGLVLLFTGLPFAGFLPYALAAIGAQLLFVFPRVVRYG